MTELIDGSIFQFQTQFGGDNFCTGQGCDITQHFFSSVAKTRSFYCNAGEGTTQFVQQQGGESFAFDVLSDDEQFLAGLNDLFEQRQDFLNVGDLLVGDEQQSIIQNSFHLVGIGYHVWGDVAAVKLHTFYYFGVGFSGLGFFQSDNAVSGNFFHSFCNQVADYFIAAGNGSNSCDISRAVYLLGVCNNSFYSGVNCFLDTFFEYHWVSTSSNVLHTFANQSLSKQGSGGGTVTSSIVCLGCNFFYQLCAHVFKWVRQFDFFCDGNTVVCDQWCTEFFVKNNIASFWTKGDFNGISQLVNTSL